MRFAVSGPRSRRAGCGWDSRRSRMGCTRNCTRTRPAAGSHTMTALVRWRGVALVAMAAGALLPLALAQRARGRYERALAARDATAAAAYLTIVTPPPARGAGYDLPQLLIRARALEDLPGFSGRFKISHATAPLVHATAPPLPAATLQRVRREVAVRWTGDAALAPLLDRDGWDVVGAVAARPAAGTWPVSPW